MWRRAAQDLYVSPSYLRLVSADELLEIYMCRQATQDLYVSASYAKFAGKATCDVCREHDGSVCRAVHDDAVVCCERGDVRC